MALYWLLHWYVYVWRELTTYYYMDAQTTAHAVKLVAVDFVVVVVYSIVRSYCVVIVVEM